MIMSAAKIFWFPPGGVSLCGTCARSHTCSESTIVVSTRKGQAEKMKWLIELGKCRDRKLRDLSSLLVSDVQFHQLAEILDDIRATRVLSKLSSVFFLKLAKVLSH